MTATTKLAIVAITAISVHPAAGFAATLLVPTSGDAALPDQCCAAEQPTGPTAPQIQGQSDPQSASILAFAPVDRPSETGISAAQPNADSLSDAPSVPQWRRLLEAIVGLCGQR